MHKSTIVDPRNTDLQGIFPKSLARSRERCMCEGAGHSCDEPHAQEEGKKKILFGPSEYLPLLETVRLHEKNSSSNEANGTWARLCQEQLVIINSLIAERDGFSLAFENEKKLNRTSVQESLKQRDDFLELQRKNKEQKKEIAQLLRELEKSRKAKNNILRLSIAKKTKEVPTQ